MRFSQHYFREETIGDVQTQNIPLSTFEEDGFKVFKMEILETLDAINSSFSQQYNAPLWKDIKNHHKDSKVFSGTAYKMFKASLEGLQDVNAKDIDVRIPEQMTDELTEFFSKNKGKEFGPWKLVVSEKDGNQIKAVLSTSSKFANDIKNVEFNFEPTFYEDGEPVPSTVFGQDAKWENLSDEDKDVFHEYLVKNLVGSETLEDISIVTKSGKISDTKQTDNPKLLGFRVEDNFGTRFSPNTDSSGEIEIANGKKSYNTSHKEETDLDKNLGNIYSVVFGKIATDEDIEQMKSFDGVLSLMEELDDSTAQKILSRFTGYLWGSDAEVMTGETDEGGINKTDVILKMSAYNQFIKHFPNVKYDDVDLDTKIKNFYKG